MERADNTPGGAELWSNVGSGRGADFTGVVLWEMTMSSSSVSIQASPLGGAATAAVCVDIVALSSLAWTTLEVDADADVDAGVDRGGPHRDVAFSDVGG